jgi:hypothetical protein
MVLTPGTTRRWSIIAWHLRHKSLPPSLLLPLLLLQALLPVHASFCQSMLFWWSMLFCCFLLFSCFLLSCSFCSSGFSLSPARHTFALNTKARNQHKSSRRQFQLLACSNSSAAPAPSSSSSAAPASSAHLNVSTNPPPLSILLRSTSPQHPPNSGRRPLVPAAATRPSHGQLQSQGVSEGGDAEALEEVQRKESFGWVCVIL